MWNVDSHVLVEEWTHPHKIVEVAISPDDRFIAIGDQKLALRHLDGGQEIIHSIKFRGKVFPMCFAPDGHKLACAVASNVLVVDVDSEGGKRTVDPLRPPGGLSAVWAVLWSHNSNKLFCSWSGGEIYCFNPETGELIGQAWMGHIAPVWSLFLSLDGLKLASLSLDHTIRFWDATSGNPIGIHPLDARRVCSSPSGEFVASARKDKKLYMAGILARSCRELPFYVSHGM